MIAIFDEDGGGDVDFQEFVSGLSAFSSKGNKQEKLHFAFKVYDIDRDGYISNGELFIVLKMMVGSNLKDMQLQQIVDKTMMEADLDGDGKISFEEFTRMVENTDVSMSMTLGELVYLSRYLASLGLGACSCYRAMLTGLVRSILSPRYPVLLSEILDRNVARPPAHHPSSLWCIGNITGGSIPENGRPARPDTLSLILLPHTHCSAFVSPKLRVRDVIPQLPAAASRVYIYV